MVAEQAADPGPLSGRLATGLAKLGLTLKHELRQQSASAGLSPTQGQILVTVAARSRRMGDLAEELGVGMATVSESVAAAEAKGLVERTPDPDDRRVVRVGTTAEGRRVAAELAGWPDFLAVAIDLLPPDEQEALLAATIRLIRHLQEQGRIPVARMCVTCVHFRPNAHPDPDRPHHCAFVDAPFGGRELRLDCGDYFPIPAPLPG